MLFEHFSYVERVDLVLLPTLDSDWSHIFINFIDCFLKNSRNVSLDFISVQFKHKFTLIYIVKYHLFDVFIVQVNISIVFIFQRNIRCIGLVINKSIIHYYKRKKQRGSRIGNKKKQGIMI